MEQQKKKTKQHKTKRNNGRTLQLSVPPTNKKQQAE
jgi:hypothetical protein